MSFNFVIPEFNIGGEGTPTLQFYRRGFNLTSNGSSPSWQDIILSGNTALTLVNAKANGLNYLKLFGGTEQIGTPTPDNPMDIYCNNGVLKVNSQGQVYADGTTETVTVNLFNQNNYLDAFCSSGGKITSHDSARSYIIPCKPLTEYRFVFDNTNIDGNQRCAISGFYDMPEINMKANQGLYANNNDKKIHDITFTTNAGINYLLFWLVYNKNDTNNQRQIDKAILYETSVGTATAEMLLKVGDYQDVQSIIDGVVTRNVGVKVLDGTENIGKSGLYNGSFFVRNVVSDWGTSNNAQAYCSHFSSVTEETAYTQNKCMILNNAFNMWWGSDSTPTIAQFSAWLADQYANGSPVIIVYPLTESTTETVTPQPLSIQAGTNIVEITQGSIDNLPLEVSYKATV